MQYACTPYRDTYIKGTHTHHHPHYVHPSTQQYLLPCVKQQNVMPINVTGVHSSNIHMGMTAAHAAMVANTSGGTMRSINPQYALRYNDKYESLGSGRHSDGCTAS